MNREQRSRVINRLRIRVILGAVAGLALFSGLAAFSTRQMQRRAPTPNEQLSRLQSQLGFPFWDTSSGKVTPPEILSAKPQTSTGGS
jgi:hypothetical protein